MEFKNIKRDLNINKQVFIDKWGADPEEIWVKGKSYNNTDCYFPLIGNYQKSDSTLNNHENLPSLILKSEELITNNNLSEARKILDEILVKEKNNLDALNNLAVIEITEQKYDEAQKLLKTVIDLDPNNEIATENINYLKEHLESILK